MQNLWDCLPDFDAQHEEIGEERPSVAFVLTGLVVSLVGAWFAVRRTT